MILCKHCDKPIERIITNCFDREGADYDYAFPVVEPVEGVAEMQLPTYWCGYELSEEEMMESIRCPHCGKFPFSESAGINIETVFHVVCFEEGGRKGDDMIFVDGVPSCYGCISVFKIECHGCPFVICCNQYAKELNAAWEELKQKAGE